MTSPYWMGHRLEEGYNVQGLNDETPVCRVQLLEEGPTKDLTILVGHRLEEGYNVQGLNDEALVCRVQLLEEGQTNDLTILDGTQAGGGI